MGAWGTGIYQDDVTCDVKDDYLNFLRVGMTNEEATEEVIEYNMDLIEDEDDEPLFWFALADTQWKYGRLLDEVKKEALKHIELGNNLLRWKEENPKQYSKRKKVLEELKQKLESPQPPEKKVSKLRFSRSKWNVGDVLLYQIKNNEALKDNKWYGKYVLFRVVEITRTGVGSLPQDEYYDEQSVLTLYNWVGDEPFDINKIDQLEFVSSWETHYKNAKHHMMSLSERSAKKIPLICLLEDNNYQCPFEYQITGVGIPWIHIRVIDQHVINGLEKAEADHILIDETK